MGGRMQNAGYAPENMLLPCHTCTPQGTHTTTDPWQGKHKHGGRIRNSLDKTTAFQSSCPVRAKNVPLGDFLSTAAARCGGRSWASRQNRPARTDSIRQSRRAVGAAPADRADGVDGEAQADKAVQADRAAWAGIPKPYPSCFSESFGFAG